MTGLWIFTATAVVLMSSEELALAPPKADPPVSRRESSLEITILPGAWIPRLDGESSFGSAGAGDIHLSRQLALNSSEPTVNVELTIRKREVWEVHFSGFDFSTESANRFVGSATFGGLVLADGDPFRASFDMTSFSVGMSIVEFRPFADDRQGPANLDNRTWEGRYIADLRISPQFGMRYIDISQSVILPDGSSETAGGEWVAVYGGLQFLLDYRPEQRSPFLHLLRMQASLAVGPALGGDGGIMWQVGAGVTVQITETLGVMIGYRLLELDVENDDYTLQGGLQGLFLTGSVRF
ncbi:MAG: hypothetical protein IH830_05710 [Planctomycetes bacterium]|nr:hypothetical protein [Planctomycetota bacterium]